MTCRELTELMTEYLEGALPVVRRLRVWSHLVICASCRAFRRQLETTVRIVGALPREAADPDSLEQARQAFRHLPQASPSPSLRLTEPRWRMSVGLGMLIGFGLAGLNHATCLWRGTFEGTCAVQSAITVAIAVGAALFVQRWHHARLKS